MLRRLLGTTTVALLLGFFLTAGVQAQSTGTVTGVVTDSTTGGPLPGVNVAIQEENVGAAAGPDGQYTISDVPAGTQTLVASFVGYDRKEMTVEVPAGETVEVNFVLVPSTVGMDEVVVTSLGMEQEERSLGYAVQEVGAEEIASAQEANIVNALEAQTSGLQITSSSGQPGASSRIVLRGVSSITGNNQPLFVVDGVPISNAEDELPGFALNSGSSSNRALDLDPNIIQNVSVLKGASATALYGQRAANGVILIETKSGRGGEFRLNYSSSVRWDQAIIDGKQDEYLLGLDGMFTNGLPSDRGGYLQPGFPGSEPGQVTRSWGPHKDNVSQQVLDDLGVSSINTYNPMERFYQTGQVIENALNASGGSEIGNYFLSVSHLDQTGTTPGTELERFNFTAKLNADLTSSLHSNTSFKFTNTQNGWQRNGWVSPGHWARAWPINFPMTPVTRDDGTQLTLGENTDSPFWHTQETGFQSDVARYIANQKLTYDITDRLHVSERLGYDQYTDSRLEHRDQRPRYSSDGSMFEEKIVREQINSDLILNLDPVPVTQDLKVSALVGNNINVRKNSRVRVSGSGQNIPDFFHVSNFNNTSTDQYEQRRRLVSVYSELKFDYRDYLFLTLTGRNDWSSTLPESNRSFFYPSASLGFVFTDVLGMQDSDILHFGKLRLSAAQVGSDAPPYSIATNFVQAGATVNEAANANTLEYPFRGVNGYLRGGSLGNPNLQPEITTAYEAGINLRLFNGRAEIDAAYYTRTTEDQIFNVPASSATGYSTILRNAGAIRNEGIEVMVRGTPLEIGDFSWDLRANWSRNRNEVVRLAPGVESIYLAGYAWPQIRVEPGEGYGIIWGNGYQRNDQGQLLIGDDGMPLVEEGFVNIGNIQPEWLGNLRSSFNYKGFQLTTLLGVRQGGDVLNFDRNYTIRAGVAEITEDRYDEYVWPGVDAETGEPNDISVTRDMEFWEDYGAVHENQVEDGSYIKLQRVTLAYQLPRSLTASTPFRSLEVYGTGRNLKIWSDFSYGDPDGSTYGTDNGGRGFYFWVTPSSRSYTVGLRLGV